MTGQGKGDAAAYHDIVSAAVDFTSVCERNGVVTGEFIIVLFICIAICMCVLFVGPIIATNHS